MSQLPIDDIHPQNTDNQLEFTVSEISSSLKSTVESAFGYVRVRGEISGYKRAASGHLYFSMKDDKSVLSAVCWKGVAARIDFDLEDGMEIIATGKITTYPGRSNYQIVVESITIAGQGALLAQLEKRKKQFALEGLFDQSRKKKLPAFPQVIGVVTSPTGAVIQDIIHRISDRFPVHIIVYPVIVQGKGAKEQIAEAIEGFNEFVDVNSQNSSSNNIQKPDLLIIARGGGSIEDLWAFNEEIVVRAIAASDIPIISAIGHETDTTLADYVADMRAPTPTAAAEIAVPVRSDVLANIYDIKRRLFSSISKEIDGRVGYVQATARAIISPTSAVENMDQKLDDRVERLFSSMNNLLNNKSHNVSALSGRIISPVQKLQMMTQLLAARGKLNPDLILNRINILQQNIASKSRLLDSFHYKKILDRGFALVRDKEGNIVTSKKSAISASSVEIELSDGSIGAKIAKTASSNKAQKKTSTEQGNLF